MKTIVLHNPLLILATGIILLNTFLVNYALSQNLEGNSNTTLPKASEVWVSVPLTLDAATVSIARSELGNLGALSLVTDGLSSRHTELISNFNNVEGRKIKVGVMPYRSVESGTISPFETALRLLSRPETVIARRALNVYSLNDFDENNWEKFSSEMNGEDHYFGIAVKTGEQFTTFPIKWNKDVKKLFEIYIQIHDIEEDNKILAEDFRNIFRYAINKTLSSDSVDTIGLHNLRLIDINSENSEIFVASSLLCSEVEPVTKVISTSGFNGQVLGSDVPSWPFDDDTPVTTASAGEIDINNCIEVNTCTPASLP